jgi:Na+-transporting methylmalonyl-CoA/oxaloacetate decarboxylase gamma subunit
MRYILLILIFFIFKAGKAVNRFDISETIGHSHKQAKNYKKEH